MRGWRMAGTRMRARARSVLAGGQADLLHLPLPPARRAGPNMKRLAAWAQLINIWLTCIAYSITAASCMKVGPK